MCSGRHPNAAGDARTPHRSIHHDPATYPDPEAFKPERFLKSEGGTGDIQLVGTEESKERGHHMYGFGRRYVRLRHSTRKDLTHFLVPLCRMSPPSLHTLLLCAMISRMCPGATMADQAIFVFAACILWALDIKPPLGAASGKEELPPVDPAQFSSGGEAS